MMTMRSFMVAVRVIERMFVQVAMKIGVLPIDRRLRLPGIIMVRDFPSMMSREMPASLVTVITMPTKSILKKGTMITIVRRLLGNDPRIMGVYRAGLNAIAPIAGIMSAVVREKGVVRCRLKTIGMMMMMTTGFNRVSQWSIGSNG
jgi:hypothetical protein